MERGMHRLNMQLTQLMHLALKIIILLRYLKVILSTSPQCTSPYMNLMYELFPSLLDTISSFSSPSPSLPYYHTLRLLLSTLYFLLSILYLNPFLLHSFLPPSRLPLYYKPIHQAGRQAGRLPPLELSKTSPRVSMSHPLSPLLPHRALTH